MINWRARPNRSSRQHLALVEAAVADYADNLWRSTVALRLRWLRWLLRRIRPALEQLIGARTQQPDEKLLEQFIQQQNADFAEPDLADLSEELNKLGRKISLQYGFLPNDPRAKTLEREFRQLIKSDILRYWRTLTDAKTLASKLAALREKNKTTAQIINQIQREYAADYYAAERLVRTLYNAGANRAQLETLRVAGYTHKRWLTARDARVRRAIGKSLFDHAKMDNQTVLLDESFVTPAGYKLLYPGDRSLGAAAGEIINCRCTMIGIVVDVG